MEGILPQCKILSIIRRGVKVQLALALLYRNAIFQSVPYNFSLYLTCLISGFSCRSYITYPYSLQYTFVILQTNYMLLSMCIRENVLTPGLLICLFLLGGGVGFILYEYGWVFVLITVYDIDPKVKFFLYSDADIL